MDAVKPSSVECHEDRGSLVWVWPSPRSTPDAPFTVGSDTVKPVRCVRDLCIYLDSDVSMRTQDGHQFFRLIASDQKYSTLSKQTSATVTGHVINSVKARLRQCHTSGCPCISDRSTPVNTPCCSAFDDWLTQVRPRLFIAPRPSLVVSPRVPCIDWPYLFFAAITTLRLST